MAAATSRQRLRVTVQVDGKPDELLVIPMNMSATVQAFSDEVAK